MNGGNIVWSEEDHPAWALWRKIEKEHFNNSAALPHRWQLFKLGWEACKDHKGCCTHLNKEEDNDEC